MQGRWKRWMVAAMLLLAVMLPLLIWIAPAIMCDDC
jgi:hypothetical protein